MEWIDGRSLAKLLADADNDIVDQVFACAGRQLAVIHQLDVSEYRPRIAVNPVASDTPIRNLERHLNLVSNKFGRQLSDEIVGTVRLFAEEVASYRELVIAHGDYQPKNLLRSSNDDELYILDWELLSLSSKWADLSQLLRHAPNENAVSAFQSGYSCWCPLPPNWQQLARVFDLIRLSMGIARSPESSDLPDWVRLVQELVRSVRDSSAPSTYEAAAFLRL